MNPHGVTLRKSHLKNKSAFFCQINYKDPTARDIRKTIAVSNEILKEVGFK